MVAHADDRLLTGPFVVLTAIDLAYFTAGGVLIVATPVFAHNQLLADEAGVGLVMGAFSVSTIVLRPWAGRWSDVWGRRLLIAAGCVGFALVTLGHLLVTSLLGLVLVRLLLGACEAVVFVAGIAALADIVPAGRMGEALSLNSLALYSGMAFGPVLGQLLLRSGGYSAAWLVAAALSGVSAAMAVLLPETRPPLVQDVAPPPRIYREALRPGLALFCGISIGGGFLAFAALCAQDLRFEAWSSALFAYGATVIALRVVFRKLPDRFPPAPLAAAALVVMTVALVGLGLVRNPVGLVTGAMVMGAGAAFLTPAISPWCSALSNRPSAEVPRRQRPCSSTSRSAAGQSSWVSWPAGPISRPRSSAWLSCRCSGHWSSSMAKHATAAHRLTPPDRSCVIGPSSIAERVEGVAGRTHHLGQSCVEDPSGRLHDFLGPNGAGKSTTMRMIMGLDRPTSGGRRAHARDAALRAPLMGP